MTDTLHKNYAPSALAALQTLTTTATDAVVAAAHSTWAFLKIVFNLSAELNRIADEWEATRPEQAARMREVARKGWDW